MSSFDWKKNSGNSIKDGLIITATSTRVFLVLNAADIKPPKASLYTIDIMKIADGIRGLVLVKHYAVH